MIFHDTLVTVGYKVNTCTFYIHISICILHYISLSYISIYICTYYVSKNPSQTALPGEDTG